MKCKFCGREWRFGLIIDERYLCEQCVDDVKAILIVEVEDTLGKKVKKDD
jgi:hypothetical protein